MARYQLAATELAMACRRKRLGQTTEEAYARHRDDSLTLMRAAAAPSAARSSCCPRRGSLPAPRRSSSLAAWPVLQPTRPAAGSASPVPG